MPPKKKVIGLDSEQSSLWETILVLAQRVDKLEYTTHDLRGDFDDLSEKELCDLKNSLSTTIRDEAYRKHDWLKVGISMVVAILLCGFLIWFSVVSKVNQLEVLIRQDVQWTPHFVTKDYLQNSLNEHFERIRKEIQGQKGTPKSFSTPPQQMSPLDGKKPVEGTK
jgi:hypothetical protein